MEVRIFVATHKTSTYPQHIGYKPIHVGSALSEQDLGILRDDKGDNISTLNPYFCELTALYWLWKNCSSDIIGLVHYRRYFLHATHHIPFLNHQILDVEKLTEIIPSENDIILPKLQGCGRQSVLKIFKYKQTMYQNYIAGHLKHDWQIMEETLLELYPDFKHTLKRVKKTKKMSFFNMFIAHKKWVNEYCSWLFPLLFKLQERLNIQEYSPYQARIYGFLTERLLNIYIQHHKHKLNIQYLPVKLLNL